MGFLVLLAIILVSRMLTGGISLNGLLGRKDGTSNVSPERVQLLIATLALSAKYVGQVAHATGNALPPVSQQWLYVFGASSGIYASVKAVTLWKR
jgi:hypothetical protein